MQHYILVGKVPVPVSPAESIAWFESNPDRHVATTDVGDSHVSTVFLWIDHNWGEGPPQLFETMIFPESEIFGRCETWAEAEEMHRAAVAEVRRRGLRTVG